METAIINVIMETAELKAARDSNGTKGSNNNNVCSKNSIRPYR
jgi:hypothetical protein